MNIEKAIDVILERVNLENTTGTMNKYVKGFDIPLMVSPRDINKLEHRFNLGTSGKLKYIKDFGGAPIFSWAPTQEDLDQREYYR